MKRIIIVLTAFAVVAMAGVSMAATQTSNLQVTATVTNSCRIDSVGNVAFGSYDPTDPVDNTAGSGNVVTRCTKNTAYRIYITGTRTMAFGAESLNFELYTDAGRTIVFPATFASASPSTSSSNAPVTTNIYGKIPALQDVAAGGPYSATLSATVEY
jgi:spore coat protein U-like protein